ncbi:hypothetical protein J31TS4_37750 [Paenibacillus sp. J31TS4]|uniref:hypothetical protein n=1 Tax=Paenibacillus sp. J31TS4 TaxID=2807195 RepID=UPI001B04A3C6|nr:hypothetical protein [Paenibacillus sp. J31TS4]GIP40495.1 hypothetical protein J31TS4_37750 [Paenibacillus sp. J31TS4]
MIAVFLVFAAILYHEWRYMRRKKRKRRTIAIVLGTAVLMLLGMEVLYLLKDRWTVISVMEGIFFPLQRALFFEK